MSMFDINIFELVGLLCNYTGLVSKRTFISVQHLEPNKLIVTRLLLVKFN